MLNWSSADKVFELMIRTQADNCQSVFLRTDNTPDRKFRIQLTDHPNQVFCNGWQSWTESRLYGREETIAPLRWAARPWLSAYGDYSIYNYPAKSGFLHSWSWIWWPLSNHPWDIHLIGSLSEKEDFTLFEINPENQLTISKEGGSGQLQIFEAQGPPEQVFSAWFSKMKIAPPRHAIKPQIGWTSWYHYYTKINAKIINENLDSFINEGGISTFQIDDGWQEAVGDWLHCNKKFPNGLKNIAERAKEAGITPGIWLAPFIAESKSALFRLHPEWLLKDEKGNAVKAGFSPLWSGSFYALDTQHPAFRDHLRKVFDLLLHNWKFDMVKLDFLYAAAIIPSHGKTRAQIMFEAMSFLRELVGDKIILGCGVPMASAFGLVDYCRTGADIHLNWEHRFLAGLRNRERVSTILALRNSIGRRNLNGLAWRNDPDVFLIRKTGKNCNLTEDEKYTVLLVNLLFGDLIFTSDPPGSYDKNTRELFNSIFPLVVKNDLRVQQVGDLAQVKFNIEKTAYLAFINLSEKIWSPAVDSGDWVEARSGNCYSNRKHVLLQPHQSSLLMKIGELPGETVWSEGHFFPGAEMVRDVSGSLVWRKGLQTDCSVWIKSAGGNGRMIWNGINCTRSEYKK